MRHIHNSDRSCQISKKYSAIKSEILSHKNFTNQTLTNQILIKNLPIKKRFSLSNFTLLSTQNLRSLNDAKAEAEKKAEKALFRKVFGVDWPTVGIGMPKASRL